MGNSSTVTAIGFQGISFKPVSGVFNFGGFIGLKIYYEMTLKILRDDLENVV
jgi:hypothetical protein